jgi:hypothetical protein
VAAPRSVRGTICAPCGLCGRARAALSTRQRGAGGAGRQSHPSSSSVKRNESKDEDNAQHACCGGDEDDGECQELPFPFLYILVVCHARRVRDDTASAPRSAAGTHASAPSPSSRASADRACATR